MEKDLLTQKEVKVSDVSKYLDTYFSCIVYKSVCRPVCNKRRNLCKLLIYRGLLKNTEVRSERYKF